MALITLPPARSPLRDLHFLSDPTLWTLWPFLPVVRRHPDGRTDYGVLFDAQRVCNLTDYRCTVWLTNLFTLPRHLDQFLALPREVYDTFDELVAAGGAWTDRVHQPACSHTTKGSDRDLIGPQPRRRPPDGGEHHAHPPHGLRPAGPAHPPPGQALPATRLSPRSDDEPPGRMPRVTRIDCYRTPSPRREEDIVIEITRALARQVRAVFRKAVPRSEGRGPRPPLMLHAGKDGLRIRAHHPEVAVEFHQPGTRPPDQIALPAEALDDFEGRKDDAVTLVTTEPGTVQARWDDSGVPQVREYAAPDPQKLPPFPKEPRKLFPVDAAILKALDDAAQTAAKEGVRFAVQKLQLRGGTGDIVATDGKQLLIQGNYALPWKDDVLVPATAIFACRELPPDGPVAIGKMDKHVCVRVGPWTFFLTIDKDARFPDARAVIPAANGSATTCWLTPEDAVFLLKALPRLPGRDDDNAPLTLDLNGHIAVRAKADGQSRPTEVVLSRSEVVGTAARFVSNRLYLTRAVALGFTEFRVTKPDVPVVCGEKYRTYLWMPLGKDGALPPSDDALHITSAGDEPATQPPKKERRRDDVSKTQTNGHTNGHAPPRERDGDGHTANGNGTGLGGLIAEAQALKEVLHDSYRRSARLVAALKKQRRQSKLMASTLHSLRQLQQLHPIDG